MHFLIPFLLFNLTVSHFCSLHRPVFDSIIRQCDYITNHTAVKANPQFHRTNIDVLVKTPVCLILHLPWQCRLYSVPFFSDVLYPKRNHAISCSSSPTFCLLLLTLWITYIQNELLWRVMMRLRKAICTKRTSLPVWKTYLGPESQIGGMVQPGSQSLLKVSKGCSQRSSQIRWSGQEQRSRSKLKSSEAGAAHRAEKRETKPTTRRKNLEHNGSPESG